VLEFVARETVHTIQGIHVDMIWGYFTRRLLTRSMLEGTTDFASTHITGIAINDQDCAYGIWHEARPKKAFYAEMHKTATTDWLYDDLCRAQGHADWGCFIGYRVCEAHCTRPSDNRKAINNIARCRRIGHMVRRSGYFREMDE
jgi:hypothetical protein